MSDVLLILILVQTILEVLVEYDEKLPLVHKKLTIMCNMVDG